MSQYPIDNPDGVLEAVNYLLSGPTGLGQNFEGVSFVGRPVVANSTTDYFTGTEVAPFEKFNLDNRYPLWSTNDEPIPITGITIVDSYNITIDVTIPAWAYSATNETEQPFALNQFITVSGVTPVIYNQDFQITDVDYLGGLTATIYVRSATAQTWTAYTSGGNVTWNYVNSNRPTDCNAIVTVTGPTDRVFISSQTSTSFAYYVTTDIFPGDTAPKLYTNINRYRAVSTTSLPDDVLGADYEYEYNSGQFVTLQQRIYNGFVWQLEETLLSIPTLFPDTIGAGTFTEMPYVTNIFNNIIDSPGIGHYWYILEYVLDNSFGDFDIFPIYMQTTGLRSFTAQVIKR